MKNTKKNNKTKRKNKKKGFTLVELLAVIIILAIVVGITIPAVLTTTNNTRKKAFKTAAQTVADWVDRQYEVYKTGLTDYGVATLDSNFKELCVRKCSAPATNMSSLSANNFSDFNGKSGDLGYKSDTNTENYCDCDKRVNYLTKDFITAAGVQDSNVRIGYYATSSDSTPSQSVRIRSGIAYKTNYTSASYKVNWNTSINSSSSSGHYYGYGSYSRVYINPDTGRSCVTLIASSDGDYPAGTIACGGICTSDDVNRADYCKPTPD